MSRVAGSPSDRHSLVAAAASRHPPSPRLWPSGSSRRSYHRTLPIVRLSSSPRVFRTPLSPSLPLSPPLVCANTPLSTTCAVIRRWRHDIPSHTHKGDQPPVATRSPLCSSAASSPHAPNYRLLTLEMQRVVVIVPRGRRAPTALSTHAQRRPPRDQRVVIGRNTRELKKANAMVHD